MTLRSYCSAAAAAVLVTGLVLVGPCAAQLGDYTDQWAVQIAGGPEEADRIAQRHGFINLGQIVGDYYHFQHRKVAKRSAEVDAEHHEKLATEPQVTWAAQQLVRKRVKRDFVETQGRRALRRTGTSVKPRAVSTYLNDPRWPQMWYLNRGIHLDMNVQEAWAEGVSGKGVVVTILDDGLEKDHPDIRLNYDPQASYDVNSNDDDPMPRYDLIDSNRHGTRCAGEVAAEANNSICAVGIAFRAGIGGVRMLDGDVTDAVEARSLSLNPQHVDIYSASWGPDDDGKTVDGPGELATRAFIEGVTKGRGGKGSIFVWASGNGGRDQDNCNCDGYTNSIWTLSISSATENGYVPWYSEPCSSTLATTYSSGSSGERQIVTTDLHHSCTASHTGTSASAPLAAAICALALEVNRHLTWRDMQHIVVRTAKPANLKADDWQTNGVGRNVSHSFGYGLMDAAAMVRTARNWISVPPQQHCEIRAPESNKLIPAKSQVSIQLHVTNCPGVNFMEHVQARITLAAMTRGDLQIMLTSPSGTRSTLLTLRPHDTSRNGFHSWPFMSVHFWGENPVGTWTLEIHNEGRYLATLSEWKAVIYGTKEAVQSPNPLTVSTSSSGWPLAAADVSTLPDNSDFPDLSSNRRPSVHNNNLNEDRSPGFSSSDEPPSTSSAAPEIPHCRPGHWDPSSVACLMCESGYYLWQSRCVVTCPLTTRLENKTSPLGDASGVCVPCHYSCLTCDGPSDSQCTSCHLDSTFRTVHLPGSSDPDERYCQPKSLATQLANYERWALGIELALAINVALVVGLLVFVLYNRRGCDSSCAASCCSRRSSSSKYKQISGSLRDKFSKMSNLKNGQASSDDEI